MSQAKSSTVPKALQTEQFEHRQIFFPPFLVGKPTRLPPYTESYPYTLQGLMWTLLWEVGTAFQLRMTGISVINVRRAAKGWNSYVTIGRTTWNLSYQLSIGSRIEENHGKLWSIWPVAGPSGCKLTSSQQSGIKYANPNVFYFFLFGLWGCWHCGHSWPIVPRVTVKMIVEKQMECRLAGESKFSEKTCPSATFVHHKIPHDQTRVWTRAAAVGSRRLTAWAMARPQP
jgi:hypothetical protein